MPFRILAVTMLLRTTQKVGGLVASAAGAVGGVAKAYTLYMICVIGGAALSIRWGIAGVACSTGLSILVGEHALFGARHVGFRVCRFAAFLARTNTGSR